MENLLIVEDDVGIRTQMKWGLVQEYKVLMASDRKEAIKIFKSTKPYVVLLDLGLPPSKNDVTEGFNCLDEIISISAKTKIIVVTGNDERENALHAVDLGAYDFYQKPVDLELLKVILQRAFYLAKLEEESTELKSQLSGRNIFEGMIGNSPGVLDVFSSIKKVAATDATILVAGKSGTGKELVSRAIHRRSPRKDSPFIPINCGSIPATLMESELFGYEKGAFTDAKTRKIGLIEKASSGTLFLDEIGELPKPLQVKLLRFIQERKIQRVGGSVEIEVDLRIIAATNVNLEQAVKDGLFREDLFFRISVINIDIPDLKDRGEDVILLAKKFLANFNSETGKKLKGFNKEAIKALYSYHWPGNVRELENKVQRAVIMSDGPTLSPGDLTIPGFNDVISEGSVPLTLKEARLRVETKTIKLALRLHNGNISKAAETLAVSRPTLHDLINKYGLKTKENNQ